MESIGYKYKMLGVVTLFNPEIDKAVSNIDCYIGDIDKLIIWDNSPTDHKKKFDREECIYHWTGRNTYIASAINYALDYANRFSYDTILLMDQDSVWKNFKEYRVDIEKRLSNGECYVFKPYVEGNDFWPISSVIEFRRRFINSGTVFPVTILNGLGGANELFPLDALDTDLSIQTLKNGYKIACLTNARLIHTIGSPFKTRLLKLYSPSWQVPHLLYS